MLPSSSRRVGSNLSPRQATAEDIEQKCFEGIATFLGDASASESTLKKYYVMTEGFSVIRVDLMAWQLKIESSGIQNRLEKVSAFVLVKSAVDLQKIRFNTFLNLYQRQLNSMKLEDKDVQAALGTARDIYKNFLQPAISRRDGVMADRQSFNLALLPG